MKKITLAAAFAIAATAFTACNGGSAPKAEMKSNVDSLSYALGIDQGQNVKQYMQQMQIDTAYIDDFIQGMRDAASASDKKKVAYNFGVAAGSQISMSIKQQMNKQLFGADSTKSISMDNFIAGFAASAKGSGQKFTVEQARKIEMEVAQAIQAQSAEKEFGAYKKQNEAFLKTNAKKAGVKVLGKGVQVVELQKGNGALPKATDMVKINYVGKTIDGKVFDQQQGAQMPVSGVIPGFTEALTHMPVGSKWEVIIPAEAAYGSRQAGAQIKPFSTLIFTIELLSIEKGAQNPSGMPVQAAPAQ